MYVNIGQHIDNLTISTEVAPCKPNNLVQFLWETEQ